MNDNKSYDPKKNLRTLLKQMANLKNQVPFLKYIIQRYDQDEIK